MAATPEEIQDIKDAEHLRLLSLFHFFNAGFYLLGLIGLMMHGAMFGLIFSNVLRPPGARPSQMPPHVLTFFIGFYIVAGNLMAVQIIFNILAGLGLKRRRRRMLTFIISFFNCLQMPLGTMLGVSTLVVITRASVKKLYEAEERRVNESAPPPAPLTQPGEPVQQI